MPDVCSNSLQSNWDSFSPARNLAGNRPALQSHDPKRLLPQLPASFARLLGAVGSVCVTGDDRAGALDWGSFRGLHNKTGLREQLVLAIIAAVIQASAIFSLIAILALEDSFFSSAAGPPAARVLLLVWLLVLPRATVTKATTARKDTATPAALLRFYYLAWPPFQTSALAQPCGHLQLST